MKLAYYGPHDAVEVVLPDGSVVTVVRGGNHDFPPETAKSLVEQGDIWRKSAKGKG